MCSEGWYHSDSEVNGECPDCGQPTVNGESQYGCYYSEVECETCGSRPCNGSC